MAKMTLGSGRPQKSKPLEKSNNLFSNNPFNGYNDSELRSKIEDLKSMVESLQAREPQIIKTETTVVEKQPEIHQHVYPVQEAKDLDLSHLLPVDRYEIEFKMLSQSVNVLNKSVQDVAFNCSSNINDLNSGINLVKESLETYKIENDQIRNREITNLMDYSKMIEQDLSKKIDSNGKLVSELISGVNKLDKKLNEVTTKMELLPTMSDLSNLNSNMNNKMKSRLKTQKIINILLAVGLILSLIK